VTQPGTPRRSATSHTARVLLDPSSGCARTPSRPGRPHRRDLRGVAPGAVLIFYPQGAMSCPPRARKEGHTRRLTVVHGATGSVSDLCSHRSAGRGHLLCTQGVGGSSPPSSTPSSTSERAQVNGHLRSCRGRHCCHRCPRVPCPTKLHSVKALPVWARRGCLSGVIDERWTRGRRMGGRTWRRPLGGVTGRGPAFAQAVQGGWTCVSGTGLSR